MQEIDIYWNSLRAQSLYVKQRWISKYEMFPDQSEGPWMD